MVDAYVPHALPRSSQPPPAPSPAAVGPELAAATVRVGRLDPTARAEADRAAQQAEQAWQAELDAFIAEEKRELGLTAPEQWREAPQGDFRADQRAHTTILVSGLTASHDLFITAALRGLGYKVKALDCPDVESLRFGKEFGNRGQCNPTYFTVGNLVKALSHMRDAGMSVQTINERYLFLTAGACGPCRFGSYVTEYRKALRDAGFEGFRVLLFQQTGGLDQAGEAAAEAGLALTPPFFVRVLLAILVGDVLNGLMYRIRPYEVDKGATDRAIRRCRSILSRPLETPGELYKLPAALLQVRRTLAAVQVDRTVAKPKVGIIGEFWAMTTEGDGNYKMPSFLESEGAEVEVQLVTAWILYMLWEVKWDTARRMGLDGTDGGRWGLTGQDPRRTLAMMWLGDRALRVVFQAVAHAMGFGGYKLPDMDQLSELTQGLYLDESRGGEGHMEVAKVILNTMHAKVNMTLSVKPFGCMPSSGVSDGVQSVVTTLHPKAIFLPIETTGDGAVNVYSRVQMMLFKARQAAQAEVEAALSAAGVDAQQAKETIAASPWLRRTLHKPAHQAACTAADALAEAARWARRRDTLRGLISRPVRAVARLAG